MQLDPMQTFQCELLMNLNSKANEIMGLCLDQMSSKAAHNSIGRILGKGTIFHD